MLWLRGLLFTVLLPGVIGVFVPQRLRGGAPAVVAAGWVLLSAGALLYFWCLLMFLTAGGTPAIFFTRPLRWLIGAEPKAVVRGGPYRFSRNPMYVAVVTVIFGQALIYWLERIAVYGAVVWLCFHIVVILLEEPHLRHEHGPAYAEYVKHVPRWLGKVR